MQYLLDKIEDLLGDLFQGPGGWRMWWCDPRTWLLVTWLGWLYVVFFGTPLNGIFASFMAIWEGVPQLNYHDYQPLTSVTRPGMIHPPSGFRWRLAWPILYLQQFVVQPFFGTMFGGFDFLHATMHARKEERNFLGPFYHWSSNHLGKMAKYKSACLLYVFFPCFFQVFHVSQTFSVSLVMVCIFLNGVLRLPLWMLFL